MKSRVLSRFLGRFDQMATTSVVKPPQIYPASSSLSLPKRFGTRNVCPISINKEKLLEPQCHINECSFTFLKLSETLDRLLINLSLSLEHSLVPALASWIE
jgi:hypothetical protein